MRTAKMIIAGEERILCFSTRVVRSCTERFGGTEKIFDALGDENQLKAFDNSIWLLAQMLDAGARYARLNGLENPPPPSEDDLLDLCGVDELADMRRTITATISAGNAREVEAKPSKNTGPTGAAEAEAPRGISGTDSASA